MIVCQWGKSMLFFLRRLIINQITKIKFTKGAISSPKTAIKLAISAGIFNHDKNRKAVVNK